MSASPLAQRVRRAVGARLDDLAVRRLRTLTEREATGQPVPPELGPAVAEAFGALAALPPGAERHVVDRFHRLYYHSTDRTWKDTYYRGVTIWKCPLDLWLYQEMLHDLRPDLIVETGTAFGGSAYYLADLCDTLGTGRVVTIDIQAQPGRPQHDRLSYVTASSIDPAVLTQVRAAATGTTLVILDSDHREPHVLAELRAYADLVSVGSYLVVEDTNVNGHPAYPEFGPGPMEAVEAFLAEDDRFVIDAGKEKFFMTFNPRGYLRKIKA